MKIVAITIVAQQSVSGSLVETVPGLLKHAQPLNSELGYQAYSLSPLTLEEAETLFELYMNLLEPALTYEKAGSARCGEPL